MTRTLSLTDLGEPPSFFSTSQDLFFLRENCHFFCRLNVLSEPDNDTTRTFSVNRLIRTPTFFFDLANPFFSDLKKIDKSDSYFARQNMTRRLPDVRHDPYLLRQPLKENPHLFFRPRKPLFFQICRNLRKLGENEKSGPKIMGAEG